MTDKEKDTAETTEVVEEHADHGTAHAHHHHHGHDCDHDHDDDITFVEEPVFDVNYKGDCAYEVKVTIPNANKKHQSAEMIEELQGEAEVPGFRKGRAPIKLVERKFSKYVRGEVTSKLVSAAFRKLIEKEDLNPISMPAIDGLSDEDEQEDTPIEVTLTFEVAPRAKLGDYKGIEIERPVLKINDKDVQSAIDDARQRFAVFETLEGGVAADGDQLIIDFEGRIDGETFNGGAADNYPYILGSQRFFPEFEKALAGASAGDNLTVNVTFPADYAPHLANKAAEFTIKVNEVKRRAVPEFDDDFAKQAGYDSAAEMRQAVADRLRAASETRTNRIAEHRAVAKVVEVSEFELPKSIIERAAHDYYEQEKRRLMALRVPASELAAKDEEIREKAREQATYDLKAMVTMSEIGLAEGIEVTEEDWEKEAEAIAQRSGADMELIGKYLAQREQRSEYEERIFRSKAVAALLSYAKVTDKEVEREELEKEEGESGE